MVAARCRVKDARSRAACDCASEDLTVHRTAYANPLPYRIVSVSEPCAPTIRCACPASIPRIFTSNRFLFRLANNVPGMYDSGYPSQDVE
jgi:hypothetical protein